MLLCTPPPQVLKSQAVPAVPRMVTQVQAAPSHAHPKDHKEGEAKPVVPVLQRIVIAEPDETEGGDNPGHAKKKQRKRKAPMLKEEGKAAQEGPGTAQEGKSKTAPGGKSKKAKKGSGPAVPAPERIGEKRIITFD